MNTPTTSAEDCLEIIAQLAAEEGHAHVSDIARQLGVKKPTVTAALKTLSDQGLVEYASYQPVELTKKGSEIADKVIQKHESLKSFLTRYLQLAPEHADKLACKLEHQLDDVALDRLQAFVRQKPLDQLKPKEKGVVVAVAPLLMRRLASLGLIKGVTVQLSKVAPLGDPRSYLVNGTELSLRATEARQIMVQVASV